LKEGQTLVANMSGERPLLVLTGGLRPGSAFRGFVNGWYTWPFAQLYVRQGGLALRLRPGLVRWIAGRNSRVVKPLSNSSGLHIAWKDISTITVSRPSIPGGFSRIDISAVGESNWSFFATTLAEAQRVKSYADEFVLSADKRSPSKAQVL
jgi:hypothetical protein